MKVLKFSCTLLSDVIINQEAASESPNKTLDFIPGSNFLGILAATVYPVEKDPLVTWELFHSGKVRFGDAHLAYKGYRSLHIPSALYYPKMKELEEAAYVSFLTDFSAEEIRIQQLKQKRSGFYTLQGEDAVEVKQRKNIAVKSAHDKVNRTSMKEQMFTYESLQKGATLLFKVEVDNDSLADVVVKNLIGHQKIGRSRSAQYGLVDIQLSDYPSYADGTVAANSEVVIYAESRLIFLDEYGIPTLQPTKRELGFDCEVNWEKSQVRTFQYAPYNYKRRCFDTDRCGFEKGSVLVVKLHDELPSSNKLGSYLNEGFGEVIYNPDFLKADAQGLSVLKFKEMDEITKTEVSKPDTPLVEYLVHTKQKNKEQLDIYKKVERWIGENKNRFSSDVSNSQWGAIRSIAMKNSDPEVLKAAIKEFLTHGVASKDWNDRNRNSRLDLLEEFMKLFGENLQDAVVNLASEMAKD